MFYNYISFWNKILSKVWIFMINIETNPVWMYAWVSMVFLVWLWYGVTVTYIFQISCKVLKAFQIISQYHFSLDTKNLSVIESILIFIWRIQLRNVIMHGGYASNSNIHETMAKDLIKFKASQATLPKFVWGFNTKS